MDEKPPVQTWEFYKTVKKIFGQTYLNTLYKIGCNQINRWSRNPNLEWGDKAARNPIDKYEDILRDLMNEKDKKCHRLAQTIVSRQAHIVGCKLVPKKLPIPDKKTLPEECLDDIPCLAKYHKTLNDPTSSIEDVRLSLSEIQQEIKENYIHWCEAHGIKP